MNIVPMLDFVNKINSQEILAECEIAFQKLSGLPITDKVDLINSIREKLSEHSPFKSEPVDFVKWVPMFDNECDATSEQTRQHLEYSKIRLKLMAPPNAREDRGINLRPKKDTSPRVLKKLVPVVITDDLRAAVEDRIRDWLLVASLTAQAKNSIDIIIQVVARNFGITPKEILSVSKRVKYITPRHSAMYLCHELTDHSSTFIGNAFGDRHHTSILHAFRKIEARLKFSSEFSNKFAVMKSEAESQILIWKENQQIIQRVNSVIHK